MCRTAFIALYTQNRRTVIKCLVVLLWVKQQTNYPAFQSKIRSFYHYAILVVCVWVFVWGFFVVFLIYLFVVCFGVGIFFLVFVFVFLSLHLKLKKIKKK